MRYYHRDPEDLLNSLKQSDYEARNGKIVLALARIADLHEEYPDNHHVHYMEGLLRLHFLGQGLKAFSLFVRASDLNPKDALAACNAAVYAPTESAFRERIAVALRIAPKDRDILELRANVLGDLSRGMSYCIVLLKRIYHSREIGDHGRAAALLDLVLAGTAESPADEKKLCGFRAFSLRELDRVAARHHKILEEQYLPEERLALQEASRFLERALELDPFDAEFWNFHAAWLMFLGKFDESIEAAERALMLRPNGYAKPHHNKAMALWRLGRYDEARASAGTALRVAQEAQDLSDIGLAQGFLEHSSMDPDVTLEKLFPLFKRVIGQSMWFSEQEEARGRQMDPRENLEILAQGLMRRCSRIAGSRSVCYVPLMAELLTYVTPQTAFFVLERILELSREYNDHCMHATLYLAANATSVMRSDALRLMALFLLAIKDSADIRFTYRLAVLEPAAAVGEPYVSLDSALRTELSRFHADLPRLVADQQPVDAAGVLRARRVLLPRFEGQVPQMRGTAGRHRGCMFAFSVLTSLMLLAALLAALFYFFT